MDPGPSRGVRGNAPPEDFFLNVKVKFINLVHFEKKTKAKSTVSYVSYLVLFSGMIQRHRMTKKQKEESLKNPVSFGNFFPLFVFFNGPI